MTITCLVAGLLLAACDPFEPTGGFEYKACRHELSKQPRHQEMGGDERLQFIDRCMEAKGWRASAKCVAAGAQGRLHCDYEKR